MRSSTKSSDVAARALRAAAVCLASFRLPPTIAEELAQEAALRTWQTPGVRSPARFAVRVARRLAIDCLRRRREVPFLGELQETTPWQRWVEARLDLDRVVGVLASAPGHHRETLSLLYFQEMSIEEVLEERLGPDADRVVERDRLYKRRTRAISWVRRATTTRRVA